jgi:hypothetical protein
VFSDYKPGDETKRLAEKLQARIKKNQKKLDALQ